MYSVRPRNQTTLCTRVLIMLSSIKVKDAQIGKTYSVLVVSYDSSVEFTSKLSSITLNKFAPILEFENGVSAQLHSEDYLFCEGY